MNRSAATRAVQTLTKAPTILLTNPRIGEQLFQFEPRDLRRILIGAYEIRYESQDSIIYVLRLWHTLSLLGVADSKSHLISNEAQQVVPELLPLQGGGWEGDGGANFHGAARHP